jgi:hypothetical protein
MTRRLATPLDVAVQPEFYFDASQTATFVLDGEGRVQSRRDVSGKDVVTGDNWWGGPVPVPADSTAFPLPSLRYDGRGEFVGVRIAGPRLTAFAVLRILRNANGYDRIMSYARPYAHDWDDPTVFVTQLQADKSSIQLQRGGSLCYDTDLDLAEPHVVEVVFDGRRGRLFLDGNLLQTFDATADFDIQEATFGFATMRACPLYSIQGAHLVYADALSEADRALVRGALAWQWDGGTAGPLVGQLPADDPYKLAPPMVTPGAPAAARRRRPLLITG